MMDFLDKAIQWIFIPLLFIGVLALVAILGISSYELFTSKQKTCVVYSKEYSATGFIQAGKVMVPTTYKTRDCLVWKE